MEWLIVCSQLLKAMDYLHNKAGILYNNIKSDNVVIGNHVPNLAPHPVVIKSFWKGLQVQ